MTSSPHLPLLPSCCPTRAAFAPVSNAGAEHSHNKGRDSYCEIFGAGAEVQFKEGLGFINLRVV